MPHQCVKCSRIIKAGSGEIVAGCADCGGRFFFYIRDDQINKARENPIAIPEKQKDKIEEDIREMAGITDDQAPVILDVESIRIGGDGKFELDIVKLFNKDRPLIYKLEEGKYIIDLASILEKNLKDLKEVRNPDEKKKR